MDFSNDISTVFFVIWGIFTVSVGFFELTKKKNKNRLERELRSLEMEILAVEDYANFAATGSDVVQLLQVNAHSLGINDEQVKNVTTKSFDQFTFHFYDFWGNEFDVVAGIASDSPKFFTGIAVAFENHQFPTFVIGDKSITPLGFLQIDRSKSPDWLSKYAKLYARSDDFSQVIDWVNAHQHLQPILSEPTFALMQVSDHSIEVYYQEKLRAEEGDYQQMIQRGNLIANLRFDGALGFDPELFIKTLKDEEENDEKPNSIE